MPPEVRKYYIIDHDTNTVIDSRTQEVFYRIKINMKGIYNKLIRPFNIIKSLERFLVAVLYL